MRSGGRAAQCKAKVISSQETRPVQFIFHLPHSHAFGAALLAQYLREKDYHKPPRRNENKHARVCAKSRRCFSKTY
jgi:hypothetical protein